MDWFASLLLAQCHFCKKVISSCAPVCGTCVEQMCVIEKEPGYFEEVDKKCLVACAPYSGWFKELIVNQKNKSTAYPLKWFSYLLALRLPKEWKETPVLWVPGSAFSGLHLVEKLIIELNRQGMLIARQNPLRKKLFFTQPQKQKAAKDRIKKRRIKDFKTVKPLLKNFPTKVILFDDVFTTGATLLACADLLKRLEIEVVGFFTLSHTPLRKDLEQTIKPVSY